MEVTTTEHPAKSAHPQGNNLPEKVRPDRNLEKWAIWQPANSRSKKSRTLRREVESEDGSKSVSEVTVGYIDRIGTITTEDQKTCYALVKMWEDKGKPTEQTYFSLRRLSRVLRKNWGTNVKDATSQSLVRLRAVPLILNNAYHDSTTGKTVEVLDTFNILSDLKIVTRAIDGRVTTEEGYFRFNDFILKNLLNNHTKPVLLDVVLGFKSEIAQLLYTFLDLILARRNHYERTTKNLFADLGLEGKSYRNRSDRKRKIERALTELEGVQLSSGYITSIKLERTKDGQDYKLVVHKDQQQLQLPISTDAPEAEQISAEATETEQPVSSQPTPAQTEAHTLVAHFHKTFHGADHTHPTSKALDQATSLIATHGEEIARHIITYAHQEAGKTNFDIKTFGGILQYQTQALADHERQRQEKKHHRESDQEQTQQDAYEAFRIGEIDRITVTLTEEEKSILKTTARARLVEKGTQQFMLNPDGILIRIETHTLIADRHNIPSFDDWSASHSSPTPEENHQPHDQAPAEQNTYVSA